MTDAKERINVEIQLSNEHDIVERSLYYWASLYRSQSKVGMAYKHLDLTITVNILNFNYFNSTHRYHTTYHLYEDDEVQVRLSDVIELHFLEMPKLRDYKNKIPQAVQDPLERWLLFLDAAHSEEIRKELEVLAMEDPVFEKAMEAWEQISRDPDNWAAYLARHMYLMDKASLLADARSEGMDKGMEKGMEEGAFTARIQVARRLLMMQIDVSTIVKATGIDLEQIEDMKRHLS